MTTYTADDFKNARFATHPDAADNGRAMRRHGSGGGTYWETSTGLLQNDQEMAGNGWVPVWESTGSHVDDLDRTIRRCNEQIRMKVEQVRKARADAQSWQDIATDSEERARAAERDLATAKAWAERWQEAAEDNERLADDLRAQIAQQENPRPLTPDAIEVALHDCMPNVALDRLSGTQVMRLAEDMHTALTEPPARPEGAEKIEKVLRRYWSGDIDGTDLADRIVEEMNR